jgi:hypothetical protein
MNRSTLIALGVFAALGLAFFATREREVKVGVHKLELQPVNADSVSELQFGSLLLRSAVGTWTVGTGDKRYAADEGQVKAAVQALADLKADDFVTDKKDKHAELEVDDAKGLVVKASTSAGVVRDLIIGKTSRSGGAYLREAKSDAVFTNHSGLPFLAKKSLSDWRKKTITTVKAEDVTKVSFPQWALVNEAGSWKLEGETAKDYRFDSAAAQRLVAQLASLTAQDFVETPPDAPLTPIKLDTKEGRSLTLNLGMKRPDGTVTLSVEGDPQTYVLPSWQAEKLLVDAEALRDTRLLHFEPTKVEKVSIVSGTKKTLLTKDGESWKLVEPKTPGFDFDPQQVSAVLNRLSTLRGQKVIRDTPLPKPGTQLELSLSGGAVQRVQVGELVAKGDEGLLFTITALDKSWLETGPELFKRPPPAPGGGMQGLEQLPPELRQQIEAQLRQQQGQLPR